MAGIFSKTGRFRHFYRPLLFMLFRRTNNTSTRHRRVLYDTLSGSYLVGVPSGNERRTRGRRIPSSSKSENYGDAAFLELQARVTDLVPTHPLAMFVLLLAGSAIIAGLTVAYLWMAGLRSATAPITALDLTLRGSLGSWFASAVLFTASATAIIVFSVRRYKLDDYHGHYRIWLWAAACWLLLSVDATANVHEAFGTWMVWLTGTRLFGEPSVWWLIVGGFLVGGVSTRLLVDMRHCCTSVAALVAGGICWGCCLGCHFRWISSGPIDWPEVDCAVRFAAFNRAAFLSGSFLIFMSMLWHARYVILDAEGQLPRRRNSRKSYSRRMAAAIAEEEEAMESLGAVAVLPPHGVTRQTVVTPVMAQPVITSGSNSRNRELAQALTLGGSSNSAAGAVQRTLTKQEKKALREKLDRARQDRERRAG